MDIIIDTREKQPWSFAYTKTQKLDTGDYTLERFEDILCIERKKSVGELARNIVQKRFENEIERMSNFLYPFLLLEFSKEDVLDYPENTNIPDNLKSQIRVKSPFIISKLKRYMKYYGINVIFCENKDYAQCIALNIMENVYNGYNLKLMKVWRDLWIKNL